MKLRTGDYKSLLLVGSRRFFLRMDRPSGRGELQSGGKADGDLVSVEVQ